MKRSTFVSSKFVKKPYVPVFKIGAKVGLGKKFTDFGKHYSQLKGKIIRYGGLGNSKSWDVEWDDLPQNYANKVKEEDLILLDQ